MEKKLEYEKKTDGHCIIIMVKFTNFLKHHNFVMFFNQNTLNGFFDYYARFFFIFGIWIVTIVILAYK